MPRRRGGIVPISNLPFHEFVDLIDDRDLRIIAQNLLIPTIGIGGVLGLLHIRRSPPAEDGAAIRAAGRFEYDERSFDGHNTRVMNGIFEAMLADRLDLSFRARRVLERLDPGRKKALVARTPRRILALCFLGHLDRAQPVFGSMMSATGVADLLDDIEALERRLGSGELPLGETIEATMAMEEAIVDELLGEASKSLAIRGASKVFAKITIELIAAAVSAGRKWLSPMDRAIHEALGEEGERRLRVAIAGFATGYPGIEERMAAVDAKHSLLERLPLSHFETRVSVAILGRASKEGRRHRRKHESRTREGDHQGEAGAPKGRSRLRSGSLP